MSTPYWGRLPSPKIVKNRRISDGDPQSHLGQADVDADPAAASAYSQHHSNPHHDHARASLQTTLTGAPTERTFSPSYESPTASSALAPYGLAPRPPSYQRPRPYDPATVAKSAHDHNTQFDASQDIEPAAGGENFSPSSPLASEPQRAPSKRHNHSHNHHDYQTPGNNRSSAAETTTMEAPVSSQQYPTRQPSGGYGDGGLTVPAPEQRRRKKSTMPKSPLQKLELTLDSMTKEEKRARIEAAERRARERQAREVGRTDMNQSPPEDLPRRPSQSQTQREPASYDDTRPTYAAVPSTTQPISRDTYQQSSSDSQHLTSRASAPQQQHHHQPLPQQQLPQQQQQHYLDYDDDHVYDAPAAISARDIPQASAPREPEVQLPKRNLSFRERAARDDIKLPIADEAAYVSAQEPPAPKKGFGFSLTRSGSNKLKKAPPGDPWYHARQEGGQWAPSAGSQPNSAPVADVQQRSRPHESPRYPVQQRQGSYQEPSYAATPARRPSAAAAPSTNRALAANPPPEVIRPIQRRATEPIRHGQHSEKDNFLSPGHQPRHAQSGPRGVDITAPVGAVPQTRLNTSANGGDYFGDHHLAHISREQMQPGDGLYKPPVWLDEWRKATVGSLSGPLIDVSDDDRPPPPPSSDATNKAWWEESGRQRSSSYASRARNPDAYEGEYDHHEGPTVFKPQLYLECGPLLRYCGIHSEKVAPRTRGGPATTKNTWRGTVMIVTRDSESSYDTVPVLRLFVQNLELLPAPPHHVRGELSPEYVDPICGHPKLGRRGETLFVRPVDSLIEGKDISRNETDTGLFESTKSDPDISPHDGSADWPGTFASRMKRVKVDGEKLQKFKDVKGFRLHEERGCTFWRFNIEVELSSQQQRIAYHINKGPSMSFWVPAKETAMNIMFHSCNGFNLGVRTDLLNGPDPMWRDVLNTHQTSPFHVMVGGGDQIYNDAVADECDLLIDWLELRSPADKHGAPFTPTMQAQLEDFYFRRYCTWFSSGLFGLASSQIPMVNMWSDRESFNGFGSFPHKDMSSPVLSGLGAVSFKYYMLFQHQSIIPETDITEPSWVMGAQPGPYVNELSRSVYLSLGSKLALLSVDCRTERTEEDVIHRKTWERVMNRLYAEVRKGQVEHLLVVLPVPVAYPRLVWLENVLTSRAMNPVKALGRKGLLGNAFNNLDEGNDVLDDLRDHWTAKNHKEERQVVIEDLQDLAIDRSLRVTILSGDVNMAAVGQFYSNPKLGLPKHRDPRYIPNIISSAIANAPPPDIMADALNKRHKVHHFDKETDECMIPIFQQGVDGRPRNNKRLLPHRNWCSIRQWQPGTTPPPTPPPAQDYEDSPSPPPSAKPSLFRRLSLGSADRPNMSRDSVRGSRPPISGGGLLRNLSRRLSRSEGTEGGERPGILKRSMSWGRGDGRKQEGPKQEGPKRSFFGSLRRRGSQSRPDDGGINGEWGSEDEYDDYYDEPATQPAGRPQPSGLRGGAAYEEYSDGDDSYFTAAPPRRAQTYSGNPAGSAGPGGLQRGNPEDEIPPQALRPFHRTPTGLSTKQMKKADQFEVDLEGGLDISINVEVNPKDPTGITVPYRMLVPKLFYDYTPETDDIPIEEPSKFKRLLSLRKKQKAQQTGDEEQQQQQQEEEEEAREEQRYDDDYDYDNDEGRYDDEYEEPKKQRGFGRFFGR